MHFKTLPKIEQVINGEFQQIDPYLPEELKKAK
jgi:hypothetical protein